MKPKHPQHPCARCGDSTPLALGMTANRPQTPLCGTCQLAWFKEQDALVRAAFDKFVEKGK